MSVRELEARLARDVEDKVLERLGYRETQIWLPSGELITPLPEVTEHQSSDRLKGKLPPQVLTELESASRPLTIYEVKVPRTWDASEIRAEGVWRLQSTQQLQISCYPITIDRKDARWIVYLAPQRRQ